MSPPRCRGRDTPGRIPGVVAAWDLGAGQSAVLSWAMTHPGTLAVIDDYVARTFAAVLGMRVKGTLGLALLAKQQGRVEEARPLVERLAEMLLEQRAFRQVFGVIRAVSEMRRCLRAAIGSRFVVHSRQTPSWG